MCSQGSFVKDDMKIEDLSLGGLELGELRLENPVKESLCQYTESKDSGYKYIISAGQFLTVTHVSCKCDNEIDDDTCTLHSHMFIETVGQCVKCLGTACQE